MSAFFGQGAGVLGQDLYYPLSSPMQDPMYGYTSSYQQVQDEPPKRKLGFVARVSLFFLSWYVW